MRVLDSVTSATLAVLLLASPMMFGTVHPLAYRSVETILFGLGVMWMAKTMLVARSTAPGATAFVAERPVIPIVALLAYVALQLVPIPPALLRAVSPASHEVYANSLQGWPYAAPYQHIVVGPARGSDAVANSVADESTPIVLPSKDEVSRGAPIPFAPPNAADARKSNHSQPGPPAPTVSGLTRAIYQTVLRPLSIAPVLTGSSALNLAACAFAFMIAAYYPFGSREGSRNGFRFMRRILRVILIGGALVAFVGLIERATWNGKLLWFFVPYDWGAPMLPGSALALQARGPFVNPDHFAGYLALIFPLALACAVYPNILTPTRAPVPFRIACAVASFVIFVAILLSLSRAGWMALVLGPSIMFLLAAPHAQDIEDPGGGLARISGLRMAAATVAIILALALFFVGSSARDETAERLNATVAQTDTVAGRIGVWRDGLSLVRDFPVAGVGLGNWPEIYLRYQSGPSSDLFFSEAHNDYLQWLAETGAVGVLLMLWFFAAVGRSVRAGLPSLTPGAVPVFAAIVAGLASMCAIEFFDFDLRIPAIALLFSVMVGLAVRITRSEGTRRFEIRMRPRAARVVAALGALTAITFMAGAVAQSAIVYPDNFVRPRTPDEARGLLVAYPANIYPHVSLIELEGDAISPAIRNAELERALWVDPLNPGIRDRYARTLLEAGRQKDALEQVRLSVLNDPVTRDHNYLAPRIVAYLSPESRAAIEQGFSEAVKRRYLRAADAFGDYYAAQGRFGEEAAMFATVAQKETEPEIRAAYFTRAGEAYSRAGDTQSAMAQFQAGAEAAPDDTRIYRDMATMVFAPRHDFQGAVKEMAIGVENGADAEVLAVALSEAAIASGDYADAEAALEQALKYRPDSLETMRRLASVYEADRKNDRAVLVLQQAVEMYPDSAPANFELAKRQDAAYRYAAAEESYRRAAELDPNNPQYQQGLADFERRLKAAAAATPNTAAPNMATP